MPAQSGAYSTLAISSVDLLYNDRAWNSIREIKMENNEILFQSASELKSEDLERIKSGYVRGALLRDLIITVISFALVGITCFFFNNISTKISTIVLIISGVTGLFSLAGFITELVIVGLISKRDFTWINGEVEYYTLHTVRRTTYLYAVIENNYCNVWANPFYSKGTEVWLLEVGSGMAKQKVMVSK